MITAIDNVKSIINSPVRRIAAKVELYEGSTLVDTFNHNGKLINFTVERVSEEGKFFGFGICQNAKVKILDVNREVNITTAHSMKIAYIVDNEVIYPHPTFHITETRRDENTNELTIYGYDLIYPSTKSAITETGLNIPAVYNINYVANLIATFLSTTGLSIERLNEGETCFTHYYLKGANLGGEEKVRDVLNDIAEATQTIYYIDSADRLVFKRLSDTIEPDLHITKADYIKLETKDNRRLKAICHTTELGDNVSASLDISGTTQYVRDNPFWNLRSDIATLIDNALAAVGGMTIQQFDCDWRGNFLVEPGDKIAFTAKDDNIVISYLLDDKIEYNGAFHEKTRWQYSETSETESNPTTLGDMLNQTYAKVDKVNQEIELAVKKVDGFDSRISKIEMDTDGILASFEQVSQKVDGYDSRISQLELNADGITAKVESIEASTNSKLDEFEEIINSVETSITPEEVEILIQQKMGDGEVNSVITETGFTFNQDGLTVNKSGSEMSTTITEDGMRVYKNGEEMLTADNTGVKAVNLHATTYLHIGTYSRFADYEGRTGCFWVSEGVEEE